LWNRHFTLVPLYEIQPAHGHDSHRDCVGRRQRVGRIHPALDSRRAPRRFDSHDDSRRLTAVHKLNAPAARASSSSSHLSPALAE